MEVSKNEEIQSLKFGRSVEFPLPMVIVGCEASNQPCIRTKMNTFDDARLEHVRSALILILLVTSYFLHSHLG